LFPCVDENVADKMFTSDPDVGVTAEQSHT
ncbi:MAG: hypothetical protein RL380_1771, partial [Verrucomicrobiota bacterium]